MQRTFLTFSILVSTVFWPTDAYNVHRSSKVSQSNLIKGIPDEFPCYGPTSQQLTEANTIMLCGGKLCLVHCKEGYRSTSKIPFVYVCNEEGFWTTIPFKENTKGYEIKWPVCHSDKALKLDSFV